MSRIVPGMTETQRVAAALRDAITRGDYPPGGQLPRAADLAPVYGAGKYTIYAALRILAAEGLVDMTRRAGTFVREQPSMTVIVRDRGVLTDERGYYFDPNAKYWGPVLRTTIVSWAVPAADIAAILGTADDEPVLRRDRAVGPNDSPRAEQLAISHIQPGIARALRLDVPHTGEGGIYARMEDVGYRLDWTERVGARMPSPDEAAELDCPRGVPVLRVLRTTMARREHERQVATVDEILQRADRYAYAYRLRR